MQPGCNDAPEACQASGCVVSSRDTNGNLAAAIRQDKCESPYRVQQVQPEWHFRDGNIAQEDRLRVAQQADETGGD